MTHMINTWDESVQIAEMRWRCYLIRHIENPSEAVQLEAVCHNGCAIRYIKNPSEAVQLAAVRRSSTAIHHIENPSEAVQLAAVRIRPSRLGRLALPEILAPIAAVPTTKQLRTLKRLWYRTHTNGLPYDDFRKQALDSFDGYYIAVRWCNSTVFINPEGIKSRTNI